MQGGDDLTNGFIIKTFKKLKNASKVEKVITLHPMAPERGAYRESSVKQTIKRLMEKYRK